MNLHHPITVRPSFFSLRVMGLFAAVSLGCDDGGDGSPRGGGGEGLAILNSDYKSTSISLASAEDGALVQDDCIHSGTTAPALSLALSGDVTLPSDPQPHHELLLIDRTTAALTWVDPKTCMPLRQLTVGTGFRANPHDVAALSATKAYVTRFERNERPTADLADMDEGNDVLVIDPSVPAILKRIDLAPYATQGPAGAPALQARPDRALIVGSKLYVALANLSGDFMAAGEGRLVVIDTATDAVTGTIDLPGLKGCSAFVHRPAEKALLVACGGSFSDGAMQAAGSGIARIDLASAQAKVVKTMPVAALGGRALSSSALGMLSERSGLAITFGEFMGPPPDQLWLFDMAGDTATKLLDASAGFVLGSIVTDLERKRVFVADADMTAPRVHVLHAAAADSVELASSFESNPARGLPPREIAWY